MIKCLDVKDGDAIIVNLIKSDSNLVFLIDGGHSSDSSKVIENLDKILEENNKQAPDFILCTHYDDDHIGGLFGVVKYYGNKIKKVWIHKTSEKYDVSKILLPKKQDSIFPSEDDDVLNYGGISVNSKDQYYTEIIKSIQQEIDFISLLRSKGIEICEPFVENFSIDGWPELVLLGPSRSFYQKLFPSHFDIVSQIMDELDSYKEYVSCISTSEDASLQLDSIKRTKITAQNLNSAILLLEMGNEKILFSGDAGIQSFEAIPNYENILVDLYALKVPHHASHNNINSKLIKLFRPKYSLISGNNHISDLVIDCLKSEKSIILSTKEQKNDIILQLLN